MCADKIRTSRIYGTVIVSPTPDLCVTLAILCLLGRAHRLLLVLRPDFLTTHLITVVKWTSAVWALQLLLVVHWRSIDSIPAVRIRVGIIILLICAHTMMRRLPAKCIAHVRAVAPAARLWLAVVGWWLQDLRRVVAAGGWIRGERRSLLLASNGHLVLCWGLRTRRWCQFAPEMRWHCCHATVHRVHVVVGGLPLKPWQAIHGIGRGDRGRTIRHWHR